MGKERETKEHVGVRLSKDVLARIDTLVAKFSAEQGLEITRVQVTRMLIERGLEAVEAQHKKKK